MGCPMIPLLIEIPPSLILQTQHDFIHARYQCPSMPFTPISKSSRKKGAGVVLPIGNLAACPRCFCFVCDAPYLQW